MERLKKPSTLIVVLVIFSFVNFNGSLRANLHDEVFFPETGYTVRGLFLEFYLSAADPYLLFGYPISEDFIDPVTGVHIQYFQRARFELFSGDHGSYIRLAALGAHAKGDYQGVSVPESLIDQGTCDLFPTGFLVCMDFLSFYRQYNGEVYLGLPISNMEYHSERIVQYFEFARLEWRPENPSGQRVALAELGQIYLADHGPTLDRFRSAAPAKVGKLRVNAFTNHSLAPSGSTQRLYVIVEDQGFNPVKGAIVGAVVFYPDDVIQTYRLADTDANGITYIEFDVLDAEIKQIIRAEVVVTYGSIQTTTSTWFRIWW